MIAAFVLTACAPGAGTTTPATSAGTATTAATAESVPATFRNDMRRLWEDHIMWTRLYIVSFAAGLPDADAVAERLLQNQTDIGNAVKPFYGEEAGNQLTALLEEHITGAVDVLTAAKAADTAGLEQANAAWADNGRRIAEFLSRANPDNWPLDTLQQEMQMHLDLTLNEASAHLSGDTAADVAAYEEVHEHILKFADTLSQGIISQFPDQFAAEDELAADAGTFTADMRKLWTDHVFWTRLYIVSFAAGLPDAESVAERLLQNQADIGNAIKPFYGEEAGNQLTALLEEHIAGAVDLLTAANASDAAGLEQANTAWADNGKRIAELLNTANTDNWPLDTLQQEMQMHLDLTLDEASAHLSGDTAGSIAGFDEVVTHIMGFSDVLSNGIISQFPEEFGGS
jgi:hypothetical protein